MGKNNHKTEQSQSILSLSSRITKGNQEKNEKPALKILRIRSQVS